MERIEGDLSQGGIIDYTNYPFLHIEDSPRKIREIKHVVPGSFRANSILDIGCSTGLITRAVGETYKAKIVDGLDVSEPALDLARSQLSVFQESHIFQEEFEDHETQRLYDLVMFIDVLEHMSDPVGALKKASEMGRYSVVRSPLEQTRMNRLIKNHGGKNYMKLMGERYGHIHHFNMDSLSTLFHEGGFDVINGENFRIPEQADVLANTTHHYLERLTANIARGFYPDIWGGFYVAFCKSRNDRTLDNESEKAVLELLREEFGEDNLVSLGLFGSIARNNHKKNSDYDFTVILRGASEDPYERQTASPRLKRRLREKGLRELCAFNIYTQAEFSAADRQNSWIVETMRNGNRVIVDSDDYLRNILEHRKNTIEQVGRFAWKGINNENSKHFREISARHEQIAELIASVSPQMTAYHMVEAKKGGMIASLHDKGLYITRESVLGLAKTLVRDYGEKIDLHQIALENYQHEMENIPAIYGYQRVDEHLQVAEILKKDGLLLGALFHTHAALRNIYLHALHMKGVFVVDGEVTQVFLREFQDRLSDEVRERIYGSSFKAEQILGKSGYISFDMGENGKPIYEDPLGEFDYSSLISDLRGIIDEVRKEGTIVTRENAKDGSPTVSIVIASYNRFSYLKKCLQALDKLIIPKGQAEIVIVNDGSEEEYDEKELFGLTNFPIRYVETEHSGICKTKNRGMEESAGQYVAFLDDDIEVSPLWLTRLLSGFRNEQIAGVGATNLTFPDSNYFSQYSDYRELIRRPFRDNTGEILNVITGSACLRRDVLEEVRGFNRRQSEQGVFFGGDDVDITWRIRDLGYTFNHSEDAIVFHNHRSNLRALVKQHVGYGEGTMFHCLDADRDPSELGIPSASYTKVARDLLRYVTREVPKRTIDCYKDNLGLKRSLTYPLLDLARRASYDVGILEARRFKK